MIAVRTDGSLLEELVPKRSKRKSLDLGSKFESSSKVRKDCV